MATKNRFVITQPGFLVQADDAFITNEPIPPEPLVNDVQAFATIPYQVTDASTFSIDVVGGMVYPLHTDLDPVITRQSDGETYTATRRTLQYPGTAIDSTHVYTATVNLELGENVFELPSGTGTRTMSVFRKTALEEVTATNQSELNSMTATALSLGSTVDCVYIDFDNADLPTALAGGTANSDREYWCRFKPAVGRTVNWSTDGPYTQHRPGSSFICLEGITVGGPDQQQQGNHLYLNPGVRVWIKDCSITAKYDFSYVSIGVQGRSDSVNFPPNHPESAPDGIGMDAVVDVSPLPFIRQAYTESYVTGCSFTGLARGLGSCAIIRDSTFNQMRGDTHAMDGVLLNSIVDDILLIVAADRNDWNHVDLFQRWGNSVNMPEGYHQNLYWAGLLLRTNPETVGFDSRTQVALFDKALENTWDHMIWRDVDTTEFVTAANDNFIQFAGWPTKFRVDNIQTGFNTAINFRSDNPPYEPTPENPDPIQPYNWTPTNVYIQNIQCGTLTLRYTEDNSNHIGFSSPNADITSTINQQDPFVGQQFFSATTIL